MTICRPGEVVLIRIGFHQVTGGKLRPAVVLLDTGDDDFVAAPITSRSLYSPYDLAIEHWREAGLNIASTIRIHKVTVLTKKEIVRCLGKLNAYDLQRLTGAFHQVFSFAQRT